MTCSGQRQRALVAVISAGMTSARDIVLDDGVRRVVHVDSFGLFGGECARGLAN